MSDRGLDVMVLTFIALTLLFHAAFWRGYRFVKIWEEPRSFNQLSDGFTIVSSR